MHQMSIGMIGKVQRKIMTMNMDRERRESFMSASTMKAHDRKLSMGSYIKPVNSITEEVNEDEVSSLKDECLDDSDS